MLVAADAAIETPDLEGRTALWWAATVDHASTTDVEALLSHGADPRHAAHDGTTPIDQARRYRPDVLPLLERTARAREP